jgi:xanthine/uracil/vitamin C permease (AzgA family)
LGNLTLAAGQVVSLVLIFWCLLPAVGADPAAPLLAVAGILAVGSLASLVLPPSLGAAPAAVSVFVLGFFGVSEAQSLAYGALTWVVNVVPALILGVVPLWGRLGRLGETLGGDERPPPEECSTSASRSSRPG